MAVTKTVNNIVNNKLLRVDIPQTSKLTVTERLDYGFKKIMTDVYLEPRSYYGMSYFFRYMQPTDRTKGYGFEIIGNGFASGEELLKVGEHLIARVHDKYPITKYNFNNIWASRSTFSITKEEYERISQPEEFFRQQLTANGKTMGNYLGFLLYEVFRNLSKQPTESQDSTQVEYCADTLLPEYESYKIEVFDNADGATNGYNYFKINNLSLEKAKPIDPNYKVTTHHLKDHIRSIRQKLATNKVEYSPTSSPVTHELAPEVMASLSLKTKIRELVEEIKKNCGKWKINKEAGKNYAIGRVDTSDLVVVMNPTDERILEDGYPLILKTASSGFSPAELGVSQVFKVPYVERGEAYILHKDVLWFIIDTAEGGSKLYEEHYVTNYWTRIRFCIDTVDLLPAIILHKGFNV